YIAISPDYFRAMGISILSGRDFEEQDSSSAMPVVVVDQIMAKKYWPGVDPVGRRITFPFEKGPREIVGVSAAIRRWGPESESRLEAYIPYSQTAIALNSLVLRSAAKGPRIAEAVRSKARGLDPNLPLYDIRTMNDRLDQSNSERRFSTFLFSTFAAIG